MIIMGIDPGPTDSGVVWYDSAQRRVVISYGAMPNQTALGSVRDGDYDLLACESIEAMYAHVGKETIRTIRFTGRIEEAGDALGKPARLISPQDVKKLVCGTASAKDPAVRQALIDRLGAPGTKGDKGPTYGVSKHAWRALAVAFAVAIELNIHEDQ
jgi:hypothetical protein